LVDFVRAIVRPFQDTTTAIIGIIIGMIPLVNFFVVGFGLKCGENTLKGNNKLPSWNEAADIIVKSVIAIVITFIYILPALIVLLAGIASAVPTILNLMAGNASALLSLLATGGITMIIVFLLSLIALFLLPMAMMNFLKKGFGAAFSLGTIIKKALTLKYIVSWIVMLVYLIVLFAIMIAISIIPVIGSFIGAGIMGYLGSVTQYTIFAETYKELQ
jgi:hypothetical protein